METFEQRLNQLQLQHQDNIVAYHPISGRFIAFLLLGLDLFSFFLFEALSQYFLSQDNDFIFLKNPFYYWQFLIIFLTFYIFDLYKTHSQALELKSTARTFVAMAIATAFMALVDYSIGLSLKNDIFSKTSFLAPLVPFSLSAALTRLSVAKHMKKRNRLVKWLVVGEADCIVQFWKDFQKKRKTQGDLYYLLMNTENEDLLENSELPHFKSLGTVKNLNTCLTLSWSGVVIASTTQLPNAIVEKLMQARLNGKKIYDLTDFYEMFWFKIPAFKLQNGWFVTTHGFSLLHNIIGLRIKRLADLMLSILLLIVTSPLMLLLCILIKLDSRGPCIYKQIRTGQKGREFTLFKFRSMRTDAEEKGAVWAQESDPRITRVGKYLRLFRLDELPQIWNVFKGQMSFIGPRPERPVFNQQLEQLIPYYDLRHLVKPGITGWAQVLYPYGSSVEDAQEKLQYDLYYIKNYSPLLDIAILFKTIRVIFFGKGR